MALKTFKPTSAGLRHVVIVDRSELHKGKPVKELTEGLKKSGGRNNYGRLTVIRSDLQRISIELRLKTNDLTVRRVK